MSKKTLVLGASPNPSRFSFKAVLKLKNHNHEVVALGVRKGEINGVSIYTTREPFKNIHTITLYLNPMRQKEYYDYIISLNPKRIIFNPGTSNPELVKIAHEHNIEPLEMCTLVLLSMRNY
jgi:predicted CoA-binding protein